MPSIPENDLAAHTARFIAMLDDAFRRFGEKAGLPPRLRDAVLATPRHGFVHRFRIGDGPLQDLDADPGQLISVVYSDQVMRHVDEAGHVLPSSNSQPSYVLWLLHLLGLEPGQTVLEIGSGSGWLAATMSRLVGPSRKVIGIELLADLAQQSRMDLQRASVANVNIITGDGTLGHAAGAPFDRAMITAGVWDPPDMLFDQMADGGRLLAPIELRDGGGCEVTVLRRQGPVLVAERSVPGWFVPLLGPGQDRGGSRRSLESLPFWKEIREAPSVRVGLPLGALPHEGVAPIAAQFRAFLGRTEPGMASFTVEAVPGWTPWRPVPASAQPVLPFGIVDDANRSVAMWDAGELIGYGGSAASVRLAQAYARWAKLGLPGMGAFELQVHRAGAAPVNTEHRWVEQRGSTALVWQIRDGATNWTDWLGHMSG
jgi:protein-L-isoaspartate(D-aspartate) O-methyltransferase